MGGSGSGKIKAPPPAAPTPTPTDAGESAIEAADNEKKRLRRAYGSSKTILSGAGLGLLETDKKTALG